MIYHVKLSGNRDAVQLGGKKFNELRRVVRMDDRDVALTPTEFQLLLTLAVKRAASPCYP